MQRPNERRKRLPKNCRTPSEGAAGSKQLMALSTYMALPGELEHASAQRDLPIFMAHGSFDNVLPMQWGRASADKLIAAGYAVEWHEYPMAHAVCPQEIAAIGTWLSKIYA